MVGTYMSTITNVTNEPSQSSSRRVSSFKDSIEQLRDELHKSKVLLIASTLLVVKAENIYQNTIKIHKMLVTELNH